MKKFNLCKTGYTFHPGFEGLMEYLEENNIPVVRVLDSPVSGCILETNVYHINEFDYLIIKLKCPEFRTYESLEDVD